MGHPGFSPADRRSWSLALMPVSARDPGGSREVVVMAREGTMALEAILTEATAAIRSRVTHNGLVSPRLVDHEQRATHGLAWLATYVEATRQLAAYAERLGASGRLNELEELGVRIAIGEYLAQVVGGIPISQGEIVRPA